MTTFFIDPSAGLNGSGTLASPFNTWSGISMSPGNTYQQKSGTSYGSAVTVTVVASSGSPVVIGSYGTGAQPHTGGFNFIGAAFVTLSGFDVSNPGNFAANIVSGSNNITVDGCSLHDSSEGVSINAGAGANNVISNNQVFNNVNSGITVETTTGPNTITRNTIHNNGSHGIELSGLASSSAQGCTVTFNLCQFNGGSVLGSTGIHTFAANITTGEGGWNTIKWNVSTNTHDGASGDGNGIQIDQYTNNNTVESNLVAYNDGAGIAIYGTTNNMVDLNVVNWNQAGLNSNHGTRSETYITRDLSNNNNRDGFNTLINNAIRVNPNGNAVAIIDDNPSQNTDSPNYLSAGAINIAAQTWFNNFKAQNPPAAILAVATTIMQDMGVSSGVNAQVGRTLTATDGTWANNPTSFTRQWNRTGTAISGATAATYVPISADVGNTLTASVTATNASGSSAPATSAATAAVTASTAQSVMQNMGVSTSVNPQVGQTLTASTGTWTNSPASSSVVTPVDGTYALIFDEEFNGTSLDDTKWNHNWLGTTATQITNPVPSTSLAAYDPAQISVIGGYLHLTTSNNPVTVNSTTFPNRTGHINSDRTQGSTTVGFEMNPTAGHNVYFEARCFFPMSGAELANWPAFWTNGHGPWPSTGEIDVAEGLNNGTRSGVTSNYHSSFGDFGSGFFPSRFGGWHVYGCLWTTTSLTFYYDGIQVFQLNTGVVSVPNYLIFQYNMKTGYVNVAPATMIVDYVHVYLQGGTPVTPQTNYGGPGTPGWVAYTYQWNRSGVPIVGALASTYTPVVADVGNTLTVSVTAANSSGSSSPAVSAATGAVVAANTSVPVNTVLPTISGTPQVGQTLTASNGTWTNSPTSFTRQWKRAGTVIAGATGQNYVPISADVGSTLTVSVTATNGSGASAPATSAATAAITASNTVVYPSPTTYSSQAPLISLSRPGYLTWTPLNNGFDTSIIRITNEDSNFGTGLPYYTHSYSKKDAWNSDGSLLMLIFDTPQPNYLLNGNTFAYMRQFSPGMGNVAWSHSNPDILYGVNSNNFVKYTVSTGVTTILHTFSAYSSISMGQGEGNLSNNDRYAPITGFRSGFNDVMVYDLVNNTVSTARSYDTANNVTDWFGMSQSGNYAVWKGGKSGTQFYDVYDNTMNLLYVSTAYAGGHQDFGFDTAGNEVIVGPHDGNTRAIWTLNLLNDAKTLQLSELVNSYSIHISGRNLDRPGYIYISQDVHTPPNPWYAYNEIYSLKLDGSQTVERFSQEFKAELPISHDVYAASARAVCNRDGSKFLFASDWLDPSSSGIIHTYVATKR